MKNHRHTKAEMITRRLLWALLIPIKLPFILVFLVVVVLRAITVWFTTGRDDGIFDDVPLEREVNAIMEFPLNLP